MFFISNTTLYLFLLLAFFVWMALVFILTNKGRSNQRKDFLSLLCLWPLGATASLTCLSFSYDLYSIFS